VATIEKVFEELRARDKPFMEGLAKQLEITPEGSYANYRVYSLTANELLMWASVGLALARKQQPGFKPRRGRPRKKIYEDKDIQRAMAVRCLKSILSPDKQRLGNEGDHKLLPLAELLKAKGAQHGSSDSKIIQIVRELKLPFFPYFKKSTTVRALKNSIASGNSKIAAMRDVPIDSYAKTQTRSNKRTVASRKNSPNFS